MKILKNSFIIAVIILLVSCTNDDTTPFDTNAQEDDLVGTWDLTEISQDGSTTTNIEGIPITIDFSSIGKNLDAKVTFSKDPNNFISAGSYTSVITYSIIGQATTQETPVNLDDFLNTGTWQLNDGMLTISQNSESQIANIIELSSNTLKLEIEIERVIDLNGFTSTATTTANMTLTR